MYCPLDKRKPCPFRLQPNEIYLGEDDRGYYTMEMIPEVQGYELGFFKGLGRMFKRMVKFTPKSFRPGNIMKAFTNTTVGVATGGLAYLAPKNIRQTIFKAGQYVVPAVAGAALAVAAGPAVMGILGPKLSSAAGMLGKGVSSIGQGTFDLLNKLPQNKQAELAQRLTPEQIAAIERGQIPYDVQMMVNEAERQTYETAALQKQNEDLQRQQHSRMFERQREQYDQEAYGLQQANQPVQAGMDPMMLLVGGLGIGLIVTLTKRK